MDNFREKFALKGGKENGLTTEQAEAWQAKNGYNELPVIEVSKWMLLLNQFRGTMPYMLEGALIIAAIVKDWADAGIIAVMLLANGFLGFKEELECLAKLDELTQNMEAKVTVQRDGVGVALLTRLLVPDDIIMLLGGLQVCYNRLPDLTRLFSIFYCYLLFDHTR